MACRFKMSCLASHATLPGHTPSTYQGTEIPGLEVAHTLVLETKWKRPDATRRKRRTAEPPENGLI